MANTLWQTLKTALMRFRCGLLAEQRFGLCQTRFNELEGIMMRLGQLDCRQLVVATLTMSTLVVGALVANRDVTIGAELGVDLGDPAGNFVPRGYCHPTNPGDIGGAVNIQIEDLAFTVLDDPDGRLDIIVPMDHSITADVSAPINYKTSLMWPSSPVSRESIRVRELGINFKPDPTSPRGVGLTNVPAGADPPGSFSWAVDPNDATKVIGWTVEQQFDDMPSEMGGSITHYHMTTWELPIGTEVTFSKSATGGIVVPEPTTFLLCVIALGVVGGWRKWKRPT